MKILNCRRRLPSPTEPLDCGRRHPSPTEARWVVDRRQESPPTGFAARRYGISLLEVLIAMFVLTVGMLGVAALIPVGSFSVMETGKADRGSACGNAGLREVKVRRMLDSRLWAVPPGSAALTYMVDHPGTFVIDPLFVARNPAVSVFPHVDLPHEKIARITLRSYLDTNAPPMPEAVADRIFTWEDDLLFDVDRDNADLRPRQSMLWNAGAVAPYPVLPTETAPGTSPIRRQADGNYSWLLTVTPSASEWNPDVQDKWAQVRTFLVSVVVFYSRDLSGPPSDVAELPSERAVNIQFLSGGYGGGDVKLQIPAPVSSANSDADYLKEYLGVRQNQWLMVAGLDRDERLPSRVRGVGVWYRIVTVDEQPEREDGHWTRYVTLAGPDRVHNAIPGHNRAVLIDGVVGVYTATIELDRESTWTR